MEYQGFQKKAAARVILAGLLAGAGTPSAFARGPDLPVEFVGGDVKVEGLLVGYDEKNPTEGENKIEKDLGQSVFLDFDLNVGGFAGEFTVNAIRQMADSAFKFRYGDQVNEGIRNNVELYSFQASRLGDTADVHLFHHTPRYHWGYEGDLFGLLKEATDMEDIDVFNGEAPSGVEVVGKGGLDGLKIVAGKEIYWGADRLMIGKYQFGDRDQYSVVAQTELGVEGPAKKISLQGEFDLGSSSVLKAGVLRSGSEQVDETYNYDKNGVVYEDTIQSKDSLALRIRLEEVVASGTDFYTEINYAGLVANAGEHQEIWDTNIPYSELGNKKTFEAGARAQFGSLMVSPRLFVRKNLIDPMSIDAQNAGYKRYEENAPFSITDNRETKAAEIYFTYDPTPGTFFYEWDNYLKEDAAFAFNFGVTKIDYSDKADARTIIGAQGPYQDDGRPAEELLRYSSRLVINPVDSIKITADLEAGHQQPIESNVGLSRFSSVESTLVHNARNVYSLTYANDAYGEYDWYRNFGTSYPRQVSLGYERLIGDLAKPTRLGIKGYKRNLNAESGDEYDDAGQTFRNRHMYEVQVYYVYAF
jgi:hypothetical protein